MSCYRRSDGDIFWVWPAMQASCLGQQHLSFIGFERVALHMYWAFGLTGNVENAGFLVGFTRISQSYVLDFQSSELGGLELLVVREPSLSNASNQDGGKLNNLRNTGNAYRVSRQTSYWGGLLAKLIGSSCFPPPPGFDTILIMVSFLTSLQ